MADYWEYPAEPGDIFSQIQARATNRHSVEVFFDPEDALRLRAWKQPPYGAGRPSDLGGQAISDADAPTTGDAVRNLLRAQDAHSLEYVVNPENESFDAYLWPEPPYALEDHQRQF